MKRWYRVGIFAALGVALLGSASPGRALDLSALDAVVRQEMAAEELPAVAVGLLLPDGTTLSRAYGSADLENDLPATPASVFCLGSVTKVFTALGVLQLLEEDRLTLEDPVSAYFPGYPEGERIALRQLLQHTAGIPDVLRISAWRDAPTRDWTPQEAMALFSREPLDFEPGQQARYSNSSFLLLGLLLERASGLSYERYVQDHIAHPLGMTTLRMGSLRTLIPHRVTGYIQENGRILRADPESPTAAYASGGLVATAEDLAKLGRAFLPGVLLSEKTLALMTAPAELSDGTTLSFPLGAHRGSFGLGLELLRWHDAFVPTKNGSIAGFSAFFLAHPASKTAVAVLTNQGELAEPLHRIAFKAAALISGGALPEE